MFDIRIEEVNYYYDFKCEGELPKVKAEIHILNRDENNFMSPVMKRTWVFDVLSYANKDTGAIELIIEELVKKMWTALHMPIPKERAVIIDMYLPTHTDSFNRSYMNELFTKYLNNERARDRYARLQSNSRFGLLLPEHLPYIDTDTVDSIMDSCRYIKDIKKAREKIKEYEKMKIENVIFNDPATIVFWRDGSKTVVKAKDEPYDPEKGLAMAIAKKAYGNEGNYYNEFKKFIKDEPKVKVISTEGILEYLEPKEEKNE